MTRNGTFAYCVILGLVGATQGRAATDAAAKCVALSTLQLPGVNLEVTKAEWHPAGKTPTRPGPFAMPPIDLPAYCRVDGMIDRRVGAKGVSYGIGFAVAMPDEWNGRFLMQGGGGMNGTVQEPLGMVATGGTPGLARGFAVASTDTGHQAKAGVAFDASFMEDQQAALDFAYVAIGRVAVIARQIIAHHYGTPAHHAYFAGCSTGGREGMLMAQRYPTYFDGIVSGAPAMRTDHSNLALRTMAVAFNQIAPRDAEGKLMTEQAFSDADRKTVIDALLAACDANDGVEDGMIFDPLACRFEPETLVCEGAKADDCLSAQQVAAMKKAFAGPRDSRGYQVYPGFLYDTGITAQGFIPGILRRPGPPVGPMAALEQDIDREARVADKSPQQILTDTATWTNLSTFSGRGGKLVFYHGVSDPWFSALETLRYYDELGKVNGGAEAVRGWSRVFLSPGMGHCGGGALDSFDLVSAIVDWAEKGEAPDAVVATGRALPGRSRPLCPHPQHTHYKGQGDTEDAANFECRD